MSAKILAEKFQSIKQGALIGAGIRAAGKGIFCLSQFSNLKVPSKEEFLKSKITTVECNLEKVYNKNVAKETINKVKEQIKESVDFDYPSYSKNFKSLIEETKKQIPASIVRTAGFVALVGAGIGLGIDAIKKAKSQN